MKDKENPLDILKSLFLDQEDNPAFRGSDEDRRLFMVALKGLEAQARAYFKKYGDKEPTDD